MVSELWMYLGNIVIHSELVRRHNFYACLTRQQKEALCGIMWVSF